LASAVEGVSRDERLGEVAAHAVAQDGDARLDVDSRLERRRRATLAIEAAVARADADDRVVVVQEFGGCESAEEIDARVLHLASQPLHHGTERDDSTTVIR